MAGQQLQASNKIIEKGLVMSVKEKREGRLLNKKEFAEMFRISVPTLDRYISRGMPQIQNSGHSIDLNRVPRVYVGGQMFFSRKDAEKLLADAIRQGKIKE